MMKVEGNVFVDEKIKVFEWAFEMLQCNDAMSLARSMSIIFSNRMTFHFGEAHFHKNLIKISLPLWRRATEEQKENLVKHEVAHHVACKQFGRCIAHHGPEWQNVMRKGKQEPIVSYSIDRTGLGRKVLRFEAACSCQIHHVSKRRMIQMKNGVSCICTNCKDLLLPTGQFSVMRTA